MPKEKNKTNHDPDLIILRERGVNAKGFGHVAKRVMTDWSLEAGAKGLYAYLSSYAGSGEEAYMRRSRILAELGIGELTYKTYMSELEKRNYIIRAQSRSAGGVFSVSVVEFVMIPAHLAKEIREAQENETKPTMYSGTVYALGYGTIPKLVARDTRLSIKAKALYAYISVFASVNGEAFPSRDKILKDLDINKNSYTKYLKELVTLGYLTTSRARTEGRLGNTVFRLNMFPEEALQEQKSAEDKKPETDAPCPKKHTTVEDAPCPKNHTTVEDAPCPKKHTTAAPCPKKQPPVEPCPEKHTTVFNTNTILGTNTKNPLLDRLMDTVRERINYEILLFAYEREPQALEALHFLMEEFYRVFSTNNPRIQIGSEVYFTRNVSEVLMQVSNEATVAVIERYLAHTETVYNPGAYLLKSIYQEILKPSNMFDAEEM